jgi:signal transduction histidine kinase
MPEGGRLTLAVDQGPVLPGQRTPSARLTITDTGRGIPAERLANLFTAYETTGGAGGARRRSGTGLGLLVVKKLVEDAGGTIEVHSRLGVGTTFTLCLPADPRLAADAHPLRSARRGPHPGHRR